MVQASGRRLGQDHDHDGSGTGGDTLNPTSVSTEHVQTDQGTVWDQTTNDPLTHITALSIIENAGKVSSTSYATTGNVSGALDATELPDAASLYGRQVFRSGTVVDQKSFVAPRVLSNTIKIINELEVTVSQGDTTSLQDSGWVDITTSSVLNNPLVGVDLQAKLDTQTNGDKVEPVDRTFWGVMFKWRLDA